MKAEISKAKTEIAENYHVTFDFYLEQILVCEGWMQEAEDFLEKRGT